MILMLHRHDFTENFRHKFMNPKPTASKVPHANSCRRCVMDLIVIQILGTAALLLTQLFVAVHNQLTGSR